jgi:hypothetical protein
MSDDPRPWLRCRYVYKRNGAFLHEEPDLYRNRCHDRPTQEDGLCDHCRGGVCNSYCPVALCCQQPSQQRILVDLQTPCGNPNTW